MADATGVLLARELTERAAAVLRRGSAPAAQVSVRTPHLALDVAVGGVTTGHVGQAGSIAKTVTAAVACHLAGAGVFGLDDDLRSALPGVPVDEPVTAMQLLTHTSGAAVRGFVGATGDQPLDDVVLVARRALGQDRSTIGGYAYSGGGFAALQVALEHLTGRGLGDLAGELVLQPLGMAASAVAVDPPGLPMTGHWEGRAVPGGWWRQGVLAAAGLWSCAGDLARLAAGLPPSVRESMLTPGVAAGPDELAGAGVFLDAGDPSWFHHGGRTVGYAAFLLGRRDASCGVGVLVPGLPDGPRLCRMLAGVAIDVVGLDRPVNTVG